MSFKALGDQRHISKQTGSRIYMITTAIFEANSESGHQPNLKRDGRK